MKYKLFEEYNEEQNNGHPGFYETEKEIHAWLRQFDKRYDKNTYTINKKNWSVDVKGDVEIATIGSLDYISVNFNEVQGNFNCDGNELTSLKGVPTYVGGFFNCSTNKLTTLKYSPIKVIKGFYCEHNKLTTLEGVPDEIFGNFFCYSNYLTTLEYAPRKVSGNFICWVNKLITLQYAPDIVNGIFDCQQNENLVTIGHKSKIGVEFLEGGLQGTLEKRCQRYIRYFKTLDEQEKKSSLQWLHDVDEEFHKSVVEHALKYNFDLPGVNKDTASSALKHKDSGLF